MQEKPIMEELRAIKQEIAEQYASFREYAADMLRLQAIAHPECVKAQ